MNDPAPQKSIDDETPEETLVRMGEHKVRLLMSSGGLPPYLHVPALHWLSEIEDAKNKPTKA